MKQIGHVLVIFEAEWIRFTKVFSQLLRMHGSFPSLTAFLKKEDSSIPHSKFINNEFQLLLQFFKKVHKESHCLRHGKYQHKKLKTFVSPPSPTNSGHVSLLWFSLKLPALPGLICLFHHLFSLASSCPLPDLPWSFIQVAPSPFQSSLLNFQFSLLHVTLLSSTRAEEPGRKCKKALQYMLIFYSCKKGVKTK